MNLGSYFTAEFLVAVITILGVIVTTLAALFRSAVKDKKGTGLAIRTAYIALSRCKEPRLVDVEPAILANVMEELQSGNVTKRGAKQVISIFERIASEYNAEAKIGAFFTNLLSQVFVVTDEETDLDLIRTHAEELKKLILLFTYPKMDE